MLLDLAAVFLPLLASSLPVCSAAFLATALRSSSLAPACWPQPLFSIIIFRDVVFTDEVVKGDAGSGGRHAHGKP